MINQEVYDKVVAEFAAKFGGKPEVTAYAGLLFLGGLGSMLMGGVYVLFRQFKKKRRSQKDRP